MLSLSLFFNKIFKNIEGNELTDSAFASRFSPRAFEEVYRKELAQKFTTDELMQLKKLNQQKK
ncbi:MAG: hypothetical protein KA436_04160 [Oligoflexales bacterium]|nr:hypothetical protein [Oligoflexales bacterium]